MELRYWGNVPEYYTERFAAERVLRRGTGHGKDLQEKAVFSGSLCCPVALTVGMQSAFVPAFSRGTLASRAAQSRAVFARPLLSNR